MHRRRLQPECLATVVDTSLGGVRVVRELDRVAGERTLPRILVSDNGTALTMQARRSTPARAIWQLCLMLLSRTRHRLVLRAKAFVWEKCNLQEMLDERERDRLEDLRGFRGQFEEHRRFQVAFLKERGLRPSHTLLEIGCGPLTGGLPIIAYLDAGHYVGVDVRSEVLDLSWKEIGKAGLSAKNPRLLCSSSFAAAELGDRLFDFILSFSVLFHLNDEMLDGFFATVGKRLVPSGVCLADVNSTLESSTWLEFPFLKREIADYVKFAAAYGLSTKDLGEIAELGFGLPGVERRHHMLQIERH